ncbi:MarR family winged helix-turn-helix transcriptional regulator [Halalkalibacter akibai]|uniref:Transcriptional regulator n=1 Tax=Halalkalibacter akibai (strain ATCC 43226 / DSM 21942 / CIP 109018 / JCM 9157 / 1139) TaxID=1236973 RepID=W4QSD9_HALA3|nr:MarR family transcriptional regulator [Halalkalibacter akibai]GAE34254.1 transcriptional regulator [Halalkalibacter akibai JCM 9157]
MRRVIEELVGYQVGVVAHLMRNQFNDKLSEFGITQAQFKVFYELIEHEEMTQSELQTKLYIKASTMNGIIESMLKNELIEKKDSLIDKRSKRIKLTEKGKLLEKKIWLEVEKLEEETLNLFNEEEKQVFFSCLQKMMVHYQK